jgi:hypothetical protein
MLYFMFILHITLYVSFATVFVIPFVPVTVEVVSVVDAAVVGIFCGVSILLAFVFSSATIFGVSFTAVVVVDVVACC